MWVETDVISNTMCASEMDAIDLTGSIGDGHICIVDLENRATGSCQVKYRGINQPSFYQTHTLIVTK